VTGAFRDSLTGLPNRDAIERWIEQGEDGGHSAIVLAVDHLPILRKRFGSAALDRILLSYTRHLALHLPDTVQLARWDGPVFLVMPRSEVTVDVGREASRVLSAPMLYHLQLAGRSALLRISCTFVKCTDAEDPLIDEIEAFAELYSMM
jgi:GGDEF domain-containing protein